jgi:hypothetical protein
MKSLAYCVTLLSTIAISIVASPPAQAQRARVFVSVTGNDANPCTAGSPCKTFQAAHDAVLAGGEISVLDTGGYGPVTITKALSIVSPLGVEASIAIASGVNAITIKAGSTDKVALRGLTLDGAGASGSGIIFLSGGSLTVEDCVLRNYNGDGITFVPSTIATLVVSNSYFHDGNAAGIDIGQASSLAKITASIDRSTFSGSNYGIYVQGTSGTAPIDVAVTDSVASNHLTTGFFAQSSANHSVVNLSLTRVLAEGNEVGFQASGTNAILWLTQSTLTGSTQHGFQIDPGGVIKSYGDNSLAANNAANLGSLTGVSKQ